MKHITTQQASLLPLNTALFFNNKLYYISGKRYFFNSAVLHLKENKSLSECKQEFSECSCTRRSYENNLILLETEEDIILATLGMVPK